jgi:glycosyltransferase involved in cell wall biosynthesis
MKILVDGRPLLEAGGVSRVSRMLLAAYADAFPEDEIVCATTGASTPTLPTELSARGNLTHRHLTIPNKVWSSMTMLGLANFSDTMRRFGKFDVTFYPNIGFTGPLGRHSVLLLHDLSFLIEPRWFSSKQQLWHDAIQAKQRIREARVLLSVSETTAHDTECILGVSPEKILIIPVGTTHSIVPVDTEVQKKLPRRYALALGAGDPRKNVSTAIEAVRLIRQDKKFIDVELLLVGAHAMQPIESWIHSIGRPSDAELAILYKNAAAFLYPSWYEGFGLPLHEAAAQGTPCVASTAGALPETAPAGTLFANPAKPHFWAETLKKALETPRPDPEHGTLWNEAARILHHALEKSAA